MLKNIKIDKRDFIPVLILFQNSLFLYLAIFFHSISELSWLRYSLFPFLIISSIVLSLDFFEKIKLGDIIYLMAVVAILLINEIAFPDNSLFYHEGLSELIWCSIGGYFFGLTVYDFLQRESERDWNLLYVLAAISTFIMIVYSFKTLATGNVLRLQDDQSDMATAYNSLLCLMILCWRGVKNTNYLTLALSIVSIIYLLSLGTRGAMVSLLVFIALLYVIFPLIEKGSLSRWTVALLLIIVAFCFGSRLLLLLQDSLNQFGFSVRIIDRYDSGMFWESDSRDILWDTTIASIKEKWVLGNGLFADRRIMNTYAHNIALEVLLNFGCLIGGLLLLGAIYVFIKALKDEKSSSIRCFIVALAFATVGKLLVSSSYLQEPLFFVLLAVCISAMRHAKNRQDEGEAQ